MRTTRIELRGDAGSLTIERTPGCATIRIDSMLRDPQPGQQAWQTWEIDARIDDTKLIDLAETLHQRTEGRPGTDNDIHDYARELYRFAE
jgi:hypothetical protein